MEGATFSSAQARERDKRIEEKHQKEIQALERKLENVRRSNNDLRKELFDYKHRISRLITGLGYADLSEIQEAVDLMPAEVTFRSCIDQLQELETNLFEARGQVEAYAFQLEQVTDRLKESQEKHREQEANYSLLAKDNDHLRTQYAALDSKFRRAADRYKLDYKKWRDFNGFLKGEQDRYDEQRNNDDIPPEEKKRMEEAHVQAKLKLLAEKGPDLGRFDAVDGEIPPLGGLELPEDLSSPQLRPEDLKLASSWISPAKVESSLRNDRTPVQAGPSAPYPSTSRTLVAYNPIEDIIQKYGFPSDSPTDRGAASSKSEGKRPADVFDDGEEDQRSSPPRPLPPAFKLPGVPFSKSKLSQPLAYPSSETEEESNPLTPPRRREPSKEVINISSDTEPESNPLTPPARHVLDDDSPSSDDSQVLTPSTSANLQPREVKTDRPTKIRRLAEGSFHAADVVTPLKHNENLEPVEVRRKEPQTEPKPSTSTDYSLFKGKGRYGRKSDAGPSTSVNAQFVIDPKKNGGLDYQYDEVVRGRDERRKMKATTCQECDEYYDAVGPLPSRLKAPLWRSPTKSPEHPKRKQCTHQKHGTSASVASSSRRHSDIEGHKKDISRHRQTWDRPKTPPAYWNIGFPSTQEVKDINAQAEKMHQEKIMQLEREAASGTGKYKRR